jgi:hypothetical protein
MCTIGTGVVQGYSVTEVIQIQCKSFVMLGYMDSRVVLR